MNISFSMTTRQVRERTKTVTRRLGWDRLQPGQRLQACVKCMGLKKGQKPEVICQIEVVSVRREPLLKLFEERLDGVRAEGFRVIAEFGPEAVAALWPNMVELPDAMVIATPLHFVEFFCWAHRAKKCQPETLVNRIEFKYL